MQIKANRRWDESCLVILAHAIKYSKKPTDNNLQFSKLALNDSYIIGVYPLQFVYLIYEF